MSGYPESKVCPVTCISSEKQGTSMIAQLNYAKREIKYVE
jgi:hypothetical protein